MTNCGFSLVSGVESGTTLKVHGEGGEGPKGGRPGNLLVQIRVSFESLFQSFGILFLNEYF